MTNSEVAALLVERLETLNLGLDLAEGGWVWTQVIDPVLARLGIDPVDFEAREFVRAHLSAAHPALDIDTMGNPYTQLVTDVADLLVGALRREILTARRSRDLSDPDALTEQEMDRNMTMLYEPREEGGVTDGSVRAFMNFPQPVWVDGTVYAVSKGGLRFFADEIKQLSSEQITRSGTEYYFDFQVAAETAGSEYNIDRDEIVSIVGIPGVSRATNLEAFDGGFPRENNSEYHRRALIALSERIALTDFGVRAHVRRLHPEVGDVRSIGYGHPMMIRDIVKGSVEILPAGLGLGAVVCEGRGTALAETIEGSTTSDFTSLIGLSVNFGLIGDVSVGDTFRAEYQDRLVRAVDVLTPAVNIDDYEVVYSLAAGPIHVNRYYPESAVGTILFRGSGLPATPRLDDSSNSLLVGGVGPGHHAVVATNISTYLVENLRQLDSVLAGYALTGNEATAKFWTKGHVSGFYGLWYQPHGTGIGGSNPPEPTWAGLVAGTSEAVSEVVYLVSAADPTADIGNAVQDPTGAWSGTVVSVVDLGGPGPYIARVTLDSGSAFPTVAQTYGAATPWSSYTITNVLHHMAVVGDATVATSSRALWVTPMVLLASAVDPTPDIGNTVQDPTGAWSGTVVRVEDLGGPGPYVAYIKLDAGSAYPTNGQTYGSAGPWSSYTITAVYQNEFTAGMTATLWAGVVGASSNLGQILIDEPGQTWAGNLVAGDLTIDTTGLNYDFLAPPTGMSAVVVGDYLAITMEDGAAPELYGIYPITGRTADTISFGGGWPIGAAPANDATRKYSFTVVDGRFGTGALLALGAAKLLFFASGTTATSAYSGSTQDVAFLLLSAAAQLAGFSFLSPGTYTGAADDEFVIRTSVTEDDVDANLKLTISDIPGGILTPNTPEGTIEINDEEIHVGGHIDVYSHASVGEQASMLSEVVDNDPVVSGTDLNWVGPNDTLGAAAFLGAADMTDKVLVIQEGEYADAYRILSGPSGGTVVIDTELTNSGTALRFYVTDEIDVELTAPVVTKVARRADLKTSLSKYVKAGVLSAYLNFADYGVEPELDVLRIHDGPDQGDYTIVALADGGEALELGTVLSWEATGITFEIFKPVEPVPAPVVRIKRVNIYEEGADSGLIVPLRDPVDVRSGEMSNAGLGLKVPNVERTGPTGTVVGASLFSDVAADYVADRVLVGDLLVVDDGPNAGVYVIASITTHLGSPALTITTTFPTGAGASTYQIGPPSYGTVRASFLDPTFVSVDQDTLLEVGGLQFRPDSLAWGTVADFSSTDYDLFTDGVDLDGLQAPVGGADFRRFGIEVGDLVRLLSRAYKSDLPGFAVASANVANAALTIQFEGEAAKTMYFQGTNPISLTSAGFPGGIVEQIEAAFPRITATVETVVNDFLVLRSSETFRVVASSALTDLMFTAGYNTIGSGNYEVASIAPDGKTLNLVEYGTVTPMNVTTAYTGVAVVVQRLGVQRIGPAAMSQQVDDLGLYYFDFDIVSVRPGNENNLAADTKLTMTLYESLGYRMESANEALTFSVEEELHIVATPYIMDPGKNDRMGTDLVFLPDKELQFIRDVDATISSIDGTLRRAVDRVVTQSPLAKHFSPAYVYFALSWSAGPSVAVMREELSRYLRQVADNGVLRPYDVMKVAWRLGASGVTTPLEVVAVVHERSRGLVGYRSTSELTFDDSVRVVDDTTGLLLTRT